MSKHPQDERLRLRIVGLDCTTCSLVIHRALKDVKGVRNVGVSYMMDLALVDYDPSMVNKEEIMSLFLLQEAADIIYHFTTMRLDFLKEVEEL